MSDAVIYRNGKPITFDHFPEGPTDEELKLAHQAYRARRGFREPDRCAGQGSHSNIIGTPRKAKHRGGRIGGVTIK